MFGVFVVKNNFTKRKINFCLSFPSPKVKCLFFRFHLYPNCTEKKVFQKNVAKKKFRIQINCQGYLNGLKFYTTIAIQENCLSGEIFVLLSTLSKFTFFVSLISVNHWFQKPFTVSNSNAYLKFPLKNKLYSKA